MDHGHTLGKEGTTLWIIAAAAMWAVAFFTDSSAPLTGDTGICLPSPNQWNIPREWGIGLNFTLFISSAVILWLLNKEYTLVKGTETALTGIYLLAASSNRWISGPLSSSVIIAMANLLCMYILFGCYRKRNATQELFAIATVLALGSMIQYAFVFLLPVYIIGAIMMKCLDIKGILAFIMGLCAPYWVGLGLGLLSPGNFHLPTITNLFNGYAPSGILFAGLCSVAVTVLCGLLLGLNNMVKLYAGNTRRRLNNNFACLLGLISAICVIVDFNNMLAYLATVYLITALQFGNLFSLWRISHAWVWQLVITAIYITLFAFMAN